MRVELFPRKEFEIHLDSGEVIKGRYTTWSVKRLCDKKKISLSKLSGLFNEENLSFDLVCELILCSVEYLIRKEKKPMIYTDIDVCDWIDEMGGIMSATYLGLLNHLGSQEESEEKKSPTESLNGETLKESQGVPV